MILKKWEELPSELKTQDVRYYYDIFSRKKVHLILKRTFDIIVSLVMLILLSPLFLVLAVAIKAETRGPVFYRQTRVTQYGKQFRIFKFRTMFDNANEIGSQLTVNNDTRITKVGKAIRKYRLDEICQLIDILRGTMTFVGTRPEVPEYVEYYTNEMLATLLMPAGVTSKACIFYKDEDKQLEEAEDVERVYIKEILPQKMYYNLKDIEEFSIWNDIKLMLMTVFAVLGKEYKEDCQIPEKERVEEIA